MTHNKHLILFVLVLFLIGCGRQPENFAPAGEAETASETTPTPRPTSPPPVGATVLADGQLVAVNPPLALSFEANGRLLALNVQPGDAVAAGDVIATLDDVALQDAFTNAQLQVTQAEISLAQAQLSRDNLLNWEPDETAVALAEANLAAAQAAYDNAVAADAASGNSLTSARVNLEQAERQLAQAQDAYNTAFDPGREWETFVADPSCLPGQGGPVPCTGPSPRSQIEAEREGATRAVEFAEENLEVARAQYNLAVAGLNNDTAVSAEASVVSAQQALEQATNGPKESEIRAAELQVEQAGVGLEQALFSLQQAQDALAKAELTAPWDGAVISVEVSPGGIIGAGAPIVTLLNTTQLQFHTSNLSERDVAQIAPGQPATIVLKSYPNSEIEGTVAGVAPQAAGMVGDAAVFTVKIDITTDDLTLRPGMTGRVEIRSEE